MINFSNFIKCKTENDIIREKYLNEDIFTVGTKITNGKKIGEIIRRGPNYVICLDENKNIFRSWITDIVEYIEEKPKKINKYRNYNNSKDTMDSVQSATIFLGMLPEHSYKIRRAVERTILEGMDYDTAVNYISEDLKSSFLVTKAIEYYDAILSEAINPTQKAKDASTKIINQAKAQGTLAAAKIKAKEVQDNIIKKATNSAKMKEDVDLDEAIINLRTRREKRSKLNPNDIRVQSQKGMPLAKQIRRESGLGEEQIEEKKGPCWKGYQMVGMKMKNGREVPDCVPEEAVEEDLSPKQRKIAKLAKPKNKIDATDLEILRSTKKEDFSNWREEINLSDNLFEKTSGNINLNPDTRDCPGCGNKMDETSNTCPQCDINHFRTKYHEEDYDLYEKKLTDRAKSKIEDIVKGMKRNISSLKARYGDRWKEVMYATATKKAMAMEEVEELDESRDRFGVFDRKKRIWVQSGISQQSAMQLRRRLIASGRSSREITIRRVN